ncbi:MFS transporter [Streptomyces sp. URMC 123]|uniref:MFS transporter n=1 Tax=Streptomyces sp. URMC 123 TaxID=3423403 RepID=UPI003F1D59E7
MTQPHLSAVPPPAAGPPASRLFFTLFFTLTSFAEGGQAVVLLWLTYALTSNAFLIGVMVVLGYLPAALLGLLFKRFADRGRANLVARATNTVLSGVSLLLAVQHLSSGDHVALSITAIALSQIVLSIAKMFNKAALNRLIRASFEAEAAKSFLAMSQSASLIGQVFGAGLAGVALAQGWVTASLFCAAAAYAASALSLARGTRGVAARRRGEERRRGAERFGQRAEHRERGADGPGPAPIHWHYGLVAVLVFSVPSSGALQFLNTLLVPLADAVAPGRPSYYALLNIVTVCGGFLAGILLSASAVSPRRVLAWALPATTLLALALAVFDSRLVVAVVGFALSLVVTCHVICMQVLTNQVPQEHEVGQFAVVRNVVASLAKAGYAFAAGTLAGLWGVTVASVVLAGSTALFALAWLVTRPLPHVMGPPPDVSSKSRLTPEEPKAGAGSG